MLKMQVVADKISILTASHDRLDDPVTFCIGQAVQQSERLSTLTCASDADVSPQVLNLISNPVKGYGSIKRCEVKRLCMEAGECDNNEDYMLNIEVEDGGSLQQVIATIRPNGCLMGTR